jgi:hypothetical protein
VLEFLGTLLGIGLLGSSGTLCHSGFLKVEGALIAIGLRSKAGTLSKGGFRFSTGTLFGNGVLSLFRHATRYWFTSNLTGTLA